METTELTSERAPTARRTRFMIGVALIAVSFTVYFAYFVILLFLPFSRETKAAAVLAASVISWAGFALGIFLAGHEGYHLVKRICLRRTQHKKP